MRLALAAITLGLLVPVYGQEAQSFKSLLQSKEKWGVSVYHNDKPNLQVRIGARLEAETVFSNADVSGSSTDITAQDMYLRRVRFQFESLFLNDWRYYMDLRNDNANKEDTGEQSFSIGDAFIERKSVLNIDGLYIRAFRAKALVSRTQTSSSSELIHNDRATVADEASQFVIHNRRATNIQLNGVFDKFAFQLILADGVQKQKFHDAKGKSLSSGAITEENLMVGTHLRFYPFSGWEDKKIKETYFGEGQHFSFGGGVFHTGGIKYNNSSLSQVSSLHRTLLNGELSFHYKRFSFQSEYYRFNGVVEDFSATTARVGTSSGYYAQAEIFLGDEFGLFGRHEFWDRFNESDNYDYKSHILGLNWYYLKNKIRFGLAYQSDRYQSQIRESNSRKQVTESEDMIKFTSNWYF